MPLFYGVPLPPEWLEEDWPNCIRCRFMFTRHRSGICARCRWTYSGRP
jgi:hypothetical protein